jgi:hypothetical protein
MAHLEAQVPEPAWPATSRCRVPTTTFLRRHRKHTPCAGGVAFTTHRGTHSCNMHAASVSTNSKGPTA